MSEFKAVETKEELDNLDQDDILKGYLHGLSDSDEPGSDKSRGFHHGWLNAQIDKGRIPIGVSQDKLVRSVLGSRVHAH